jgi:hypothetical protein
MVFYNVMPCSLVGTQQHFGRTCPFHLQDKGVHPDDGGSRFLKNVGTYLSNYMASHP